MRASSSFCYFFCIILLLSAQYLVQCDTDDTAISDTCLECLAKAGSENAGICGAFHEVGYELCGVFKMTQTYYVDCLRDRLFKPPFGVDDWKMCALNYTCAADAVRAYMRLYGGNRDCQPLTCESFIRIHAGGPEGCADKNKEYTAILVGNTTRLCGCEVVYEDKETCKPTLIPPHLLPVVIAVPIAGLVIILIVIITVCCCCCNRATQSINTSIAARSTQPIVPRNIGLAHSLDEDGYKLANDPNLNTNHYLRDHSMPQVKLNQPEQPIPPEQPPRATLTFTTEDGHMSTLDMRIMKVPPHIPNPDETLYDSALPYSLNKSHTQYVDSVKEKCQSSSKTGTQAGFYVDDVRVGMKHDYVNLEDISLPMSPALAPEDDYVNHKVADKSALSKQRNRSDRLSSTGLKTPIPLPRDSSCRCETPDLVLEVALSQRKEHLVVE